MRLVSPRFIGLAAVMAAAGPVRAADGPASGRAEWRAPEAWRMFWWIVTRGAEMGPESAWFGPGRSRHGWDWLAARCDRDSDGSISPDEFVGPEASFTRLDRDGDGALTPADFDWSPRSEYLRRRAPFRGKFAQADADGNGRVSAEEFRAMFDRSAGEKGYLTPDELADLMDAGRPPRPRNSPGPADMPSRVTLLKGFFAGELGSMHEGPALDAEAPDFTLDALNAPDPVTLSAFRGRKPVVLIFGSFT